MIDLAKQHNGTVGGRGRVLREPDGVIKEES
jgi:hypothetical protein